MQSLSTFAKLMRIEKIFMGEGLPISDNILAKAL